MARVQRSTSSLLSFIALISISTLLFSASSPAQVRNERSTDPTAVLMPQLVVDGRAPGPAWWRVTRGSSTVFVMGLPSLAPRDLKFDEKLLRLRLEGADRLILAPSPTIGWWRIAGLAVTGARTFRQPVPLSQSLPPLLAQRLHAVLAAHGSSASAFDDLKPAFAGFELSKWGRGSDVATDLGGVQEHVLALEASGAIQRKPRVIATGRYDLLERVEALAALPDDEQLRCLEDGLRTAETGGGGVGETSALWAAGRVRRFTSLDRGFEACLARSPQGAADLRREMDVSTSAIRDALSRPGFSVALVNLRPLLAQDGVLACLQRAGYEIRSPADETPSGD